MRNILQLQFIKNIFKAYTNDEYISRKNDIAELCFIFDTANLRWNFSGVLKDAFDFYRYSNGK